MSGRRILVVEDNPQNLKLARLVLLKAGFEVLEAGDGEQGVRMARELQPDLVLMDLQMPGSTASAPWRNCAAIRPPPA